MRRITSPGGPSNSFLNLINCFTSFSDYWVTFYLGLSQMLNTVKYGYALLEAFEA